MSKILNSYFFEFGLNLVQIRFDLVFVHEGLRLKTLAKNSIFLWYYVYVLSEINDVLINYLDDIGLYKTRMTNGYYKNLLGKDYDGVFDTFVEGDARVVRDYIVETIPAAGVGGNKRHMAIETTNYTQVDDVYKKPVRLLKKTMDDIVEMISPSWPFKLGSVQSNTHLNMFSNNFENLKYAKIYSAPGGCLQALHTDWSEQLDIKHGGKVFICLTSNFNIYMYKASLILNRFDLLG